MQAGREMQAVQDSTRYHAILKTTFDPPLGAIRNMGVNLDGKYLGPDCPTEADAPE